MKHNRISLKATTVIFGLASIIMLDGCSKNKADNSRKSCINRPFKDVAPESVTLTVNNPDSAQTFTLRGGTVISVPDHAFIDEKGNPVEGKVDISYSEFHNAADIIISGIPMTYDSAGTSGNFQTAGMFEIKGTQNSKPVFIAKDKKINVQMASFVRGDEYNSYYLDTTAQNWNYLNHGTAMDNPLKSKNTVGTLLPTKPIEPKEYDEKTPVFDVNVDYGIYPELKEFKGMVWQYAGSDPKMNPENNKWVYGFHWKSATIQLYDADNSQFKLFLDNGKTKFESIVTPVLKGKNLEKARERFKKKIEKYNEELARVQRQREYNFSQADLLRSFEVGGFGIYNCDRLYNVREPVTLAATFDIDGNISETEKPIVYLITGDDRVVVRYDPYRWANFKFGAGEKNKLIALSPDQNIAVCSSEDFTNINKAQPTDSKIITFHLKNTGKRVTSAEGLQNIISTL